MKLIGDKIDAVKERIDGINGLPFAVAFALFNQLLPVDNTLFGPLAELAGDIVKKFGRKAAIARCGDGNSEDQPGKD